MTRPEIDRHPAPASAPATRERGSAYIVTLLALVVLTILGLSLTLVTQSEMQIGVNERIIQRVFYAADSGIAATTARALVTNDFSERTIVLEEPETNPFLNHRSSVEISPLVPILDSPCNLCEINNAGTYSERAFRKIGHAVTVNASRLGGANDTRTAFKTISAMIDFQPWKDPPQAYLPIDDPTALAKIKF
jgi:Tfp pilus assembly protein PilX